MSVIVLAGTIGAGKSSLTALIANHFGSQAFMNRSMTMKCYHYFMQIQINMRFTANLFLK